MVEPVIFVLHCVASLRPVHMNKKTRAALAEREWKTLKADHLAHKTFRNAGSLKVTIDIEIRNPITMANERVSAQPRPILWNALDIQDPWSSCGCSPPPWSSA